jgi:hypothetical protein
MCSQTWRAKLTFQAQKKTLFLMGSWVRISHLISLSFPEPAMVVALLAMKPLHDDKTTSLTFFLNHHNNFRQLQR